MCVSSASVTERSKAKLSLKRCVVRPLHISADTDEIIIRRMEGNLWIRRLMALSD